MQQLFQTIMMNFIRITVLLIICTLCHSIHRRFVVNHYTYRDEYCASICTSKHYIYYDYYYCYKENGGWDYCSPKGKTIYGEACMSSCILDTYYYYYWCYKSRNWEDWDYCAPVRSSSSVARQYSTYGYECMDECGFHGEKYSYCNKKAGGWDYCSINTDCSSQAASSIVRSKTSCYGKLHHQYHWLLSGLCIRYLGQMTISHVRK